MPIRIVLADDHAPFRAMLKTLLETQSDLLVVAEAGDGTEAVATATFAESVAHAGSPDVVIMDVEMPGIDGIENAKFIHSIPP